jgi:hypothetical protein
MHHPVGDALNLKKCHIVECTETATGNTHPKQPMGSLATGTYYDKEHQLHVQVYLRRVHERHHHTHACGGNTMGIISITVASSNEGVAGMVSLPVTFRSMEKQQGSRGSKFGHARGRIMTVPILSFKLYHSYVSTNSESLKNGKVADFPSTIEGNDPGFLQRPPLTEREDLVSIIFGYMR